MIFYIFVSYCTLIAMLMMMFFYISNFSPEVNLPSNGMKINDGSAHVSELWRITTNDATYIIILLPSNKYSPPLEIFLSGKWPEIEVFMIEYLYQFCWCSWFKIARYCTHFLHPYFKSCHIFMEKFNDCSAGEQYYSISELCHVKTSIPSMV